MTHDTNKRKTVNIIYGAVLFLSGLCLSAGTQFVFHACGMHDDGSYGRCHYAQLVVACLGLLIAAGALCSILWRTREVMCTVSVVTACTAVLTLLIPGPVIPLCMMKTMHCLTMMKPFTTVMGSVVLLISIAGFALAFPRRKED